MDPTAKEGCGITSVLTKDLERNLLSKCLLKKRKSNQKPNNMASIKMSAEQKKQEEKWAIQDAMRTVQNYNELMKNKSLMNKAKAAAMEQYKMLGGSIAPTKVASKKKK